MYPGGLLQLKNGYLLYLQLLWLLNSFRSEAELQSTMWVSTLCFFLLTCRFAMALRSLPWQFCFQFVIFEQEHLISRLKCHYCLLKFALLSLNFHILRFIAMNCSESKLSATFGMALNLHHIFTLYTNSDTLRASWSRMRAIIGP